MRAIVTGATGFLGRRLVALLHREGHAVSTLTRDAANAATILGTATAQYEWADKPAWERAVAEADAVFHLAGASVAEKRWTPEYKRLIRDSRVDTTRAIVAAGPRVLVSASAIGYYGGQGDAVLTEDAPQGEDFLADVCARWEEAAHQASALGSRVVTVRIGQAIGQGGGVLDAMLHPPVAPFSPWKLGLGGPLGDGRQWLSWVHSVDVARLFLWCAENPNAQGAYNAVAPNPVTNAEFARALGRTMHRPAAVPVPAFAIRALLGEFADYVLYSQRVLPKRASEQGFTFLYVGLEAALREALSEVKPPAMG